MCVGRQGDVPVSGEALSAAMTGIMLPGAQRTRGLRHSRLYAGPCTCPHGTMRVLTNDRHALEASGV